MPKRRQTTCLISSYKIAVVNSRLDLILGLLDEKHLPPAELRDEHQQDTQKWGRIGEYNVVMARSAAAVACLPDVSMILSIGTGMGVIRAGVLLGDIVISASNPDYCELHSRHHPLLDSLNALQSRGHFFSGPFERSFPGSQHDRVRSRVGKQAYGPRFAPAVHYGTIVSGDTLITDAQILQFYAAGIYPLCFDMESAPTAAHITIRGVAGYSDENTDVWEDYAAKVATAFAREILTTIPKPRTTGSRYFPVSTLRVGPPWAAEDPYGEDYIQVMSLLDIEDFGSFRPIQNPEPWQDSIKTHKVLRELLVSWGYSGWPRHNVLWLTGPSNTLRDFAQWFEEFISCIGYEYSAFFFQTDPPCRADRLLPRILEGVLNFVPEIACHVLSALHADPALCERSSQQQFDRLLVQPLMGSPDLERKKLIIFDALEQCPDLDEMAMVLRLLTQTALAGPLRPCVFITSTPDLPLRLGYQDAYGDVHDDVRLETCN